MREVVALLFFTVAVCNCQPSIERCTETNSLRLVDGSTQLEGRVEICQNGRWGTVCDDSWGNADARVVCAQLGYQREGATGLKRAPFGRGIGDILLDDVQCTGTEARLVDCPHLTNHNCGHHEDAGVRCIQGVICTEGAIRLANGPTIREGRVEVCLNNAWGTVCDDLWTTEDAAVVCGQLGYLRTGAQAYSLARYGPGTGSIWLDNVRCGGTETRLIDCRYDPDTSDCTHLEDAGVSCVNETCSNGELRLVGGTSETEGRVEVCLNQQWGTVCDDLWGASDAGVVCAQLGFSRGGAQAFGGGHFGSGTGSISLDDVRCGGTETRLIDCRFDSGTSDCTHSEDAGVSCLRACSNGDIRLVGGAVENEGRVEVCLNQQWGTVCDDLWGASDAGVVCAQLGFSRGGAQAFGRAHFGSGTGSIWLDDVRCGGTETRLIDCRYDSGTSDCNHSEDAGVSCVNETCSNGELRLVGGTSETEGRVEVCLENQWGTVCDDLWGADDAAVVCAQLGFSRGGAQGFQRAHFGRGTGSILLDDVQCVGTEERLIDCPHDSGTGDCSHFEDAGVSCVRVCSNGDIRLVGGAVENEGRVEVCVNQQWGTVCDDLWSVEDASVVCRQLGHSPDSPISAVQFGAGTGPIFLDNVACSGTEARLIDCLYSSHTDDCNHREDAGVRCQTFCRSGDVRIGEEGRVSASEGRVEVCLNQVWGTVCDDRWDSVDAGIFCQQLGFSRFNAQAHPQSMYGTVSALVPIHLDEVGCNGTESRLVDCSHTVLDDCSHFEDAGVQCNTTLLCENGEVRLVGGDSAFEGRVEMCWNETWGTVCDQSWSVSDAKVVCGQLGFSRQGATAFSNAYFGEGSGPILLRRLFCSGNEVNLTECSHAGLGVVGSCRHGDDAGVRCRPGCSNWDLRLVDGRTEYEGRVEMCWNNEWGTVCDDFWGVPDARVVCRQLGHTETISAFAFRFAFFGSGTGAILLDDVRCTGTETSLQQCLTDPVGSHNCVHSEDAGVRCSQCVENSVRLVGGASDIEGRVEVCLRGGWGTVCDDDWTTEDAIVVCRQLGLPALDAEALLGDSFEVGGVGLPILMSSVECNSTETSLTDCTYQTQSSCYSNHTQDAGVVCRRGPPLPPQNVTLSSITASTVAVTWIPSPASTHNDDVLNYQINCTATASYPPFSHVTNDNVTMTISFNGLHPYTDYTCCVRGVGVSGVGGESCHTFQTLEAAPTGSPRNLDGSPTSSISLELSWDPPLPNLINGQLRSYRVSIHALDIAQTRTYITTGTSLGVAALHPYYQYQCSVAAVTIASGPFSTPVTITTYQDVPNGPPQSIQVGSIRPTSVTLNWLPPLPEHRNGIITGYTVSLTVAHNGYQQVYTTGDRLNYTLTSLTQYTGYIVTVAASTVNGTGPRSLGVEFMISGGTPSRPPRNVSVMVLDPRRVLLEWESPEMQYWNGILHGSIVEVTEIETGMVQRWSTGPNFIQLSVHPNYHYQFRVASLGLETGPYSSPLLVQLPEDVPSSSPQNVQITMTTTYLLLPSATVMWDPPPLDQQNGNITGYIVTLYNLDEGKVSNQTTVSEELTLTLAPDTMYSVTVAAQTSVGSGPPSPIIHLSTPAGVPTAPPRNFRIVDPINSTSLSFSWAPPPPSQQNGDIIGYALTLLEEATGRQLTLNLSSRTVATIRRLHPYYSYVFTLAAFTEAGVGPFTDSLTQRTAEDVPSGFPTSLRAVALTPRSVRISWNALPQDETNGVITGYIVTVSEVQADNLFTTIEVTGRNTLVTTLPYTSYTVTVAARTSVGVGPVSPQVAIETPEDAPSDRPQNVTAINVTPTSFTLSWSPPPPKYHHGNIRRYNIRVTGGNSTSVILLSSETTEIVVEGLVPYQWYNCTVAAVTVDEGPHSAQVFVRTAEDAPSAPPMNVRVRDRSSDTIEMEWSAPLPQDQNGNIRRYVIRVTDATFSIQTLVSRVEFVVVSGLSPDSQYWMEVAAYTVSRGPFSAALSVSTLEDVPGGPPRNIAVAIIGSTSLTLTWAPPLVTNGDITSYQVQLQDSSMRVVNETQVTGTRVEWEGLRPYNNYKYRVAAATAVGLGPFSENRTAQTSEAAPSHPPTGVTVTVNSSTAVLVTWSPLPRESQNGIVRFYVIHLEDDSGISGSTTFRFTSPRESYVLSGLHPGNRYRVGVAAVTVDPGPTSDFIVFTTTENVPGSITNLVAEVLSSSSVQLSWSPPPENQQNGVIIRYVISVSQVSPGTSEQPIRFETSELEYTVTRLHPAWIYEFSVAAETSAGVGQSVVTAATLQEDVPSASPRDLTTTSLSPTRLRLEWKPPRQDQQNGIIREYQIIFTELETRRVWNLTTSRLFYVERDLHAYYRYECSVAAITVGAGPARTTTVRQPEDVPGSPTELSVNHTSSTTTLLRWSPVPAHLQNGIIINYIISVTTSETQHLFIRGPNSFQYEITNLKPYTIYDFSVAAETRAGRGLPVIQTSRTPLPVPSVIPTVGMVTRTSATEIYVSWDPLPESESLYSRIRYLVRYRVYESRVTRNTDDTSTILEVDDSSMIIEGLEPYLTYAVSVAARNERGVGEFSDEIIAEIFENSPFRLHLYGPIVCLPWIDTGISEKVFDMTQAISSNMESSCDCNFSAKYIAQTTVNCGDKSTNRVVLEATFVSSTTTRSTDTRDLLQKWVNMEPKILVQGVQLTVAPCSVLLLAEGGEVCPIYPLPEPVITAAVESDDGGGVSSSLIGGVVGGGMGVLICIVLLIILIVAMKRIHSKREQRITRQPRDLRLNYTLTPGEGTSGPSDLSSSAKEKEFLKEVEESAFHDDDHIYDEPFKYFEANLAEPPPSYNSSMATFNKAAFSSKLDTAPSPMSERNALGNTNTSAVPNPYEPCYSSTVEATPTPVPSQSPQYSEPAALTQAQSPAAGTNYQPLLPAPRQTGNTPSPSSPDYQLLGPPAGYAVPKGGGDVTMTQSDVPQPTLTGWEGAKGKPPSLDPMETVQENREYDEYVMMTSPALQL